MAQRSSSEWFQRSLCPHLLVGASGGAVIEIFPYLAAGVPLSTVYVEAIKEMTTAVTNNDVTTNSVRGLVLYMATPPFSP
jgi:ABC-type polysaccharide/polyol phosphate export permease